MEKNTEDLMEQLILKTEKKQAIWSKTSRSNEFELILSKGKITTDLWSTEEQDHLADFRIYNEDGTEIKSIVISNQDVYDYKLLERLHNSIKNKYYKIDETIESIVKEVSGDNIVGIPF